MAISIFDINVMAMIESRVGYVLQGQFTIDQIVQFTAPNTPEAQAMVRAEVTNGVAAANAAIQANKVV